MSYRLLFILLMLASCSKKKDEYKEVKIIGHGGTGLNMITSAHHDNSKESVEQALATEGCDGVEVDIQLSKDGKLWLYHDNLLETESDGEGCIPSLNSIYLNSVQYETVHNEQLVSLNEIDLKLFNGKILFLDLRHFNPCEGSFAPVQTVIDRILELQIDQSMIELYCNVSYSEWIQPFKNAGLKVILSVSGYDESLSVSQIYPEVDGYILRNDDITKEEVSAIRNTGKKVYIFELRSPKGIKKALSKLPNAVLTDDLKATIIEKY